MFVKVFLILSAITLFPFSESLVKVKEKDKEEEVISDGVLKFLKHYGYLNDIDGKDEIKSKESYTAALSKYQEMYGLNVTGTLTPETMTSMTYPRCGVPDFFTDSINDKQSQKWAMTDLTWNFYMANPDEIKVTEVAFSVWEKHSALTFKRMYVNPNILISYKSLQHTYTGRPRTVCSSHFDGRGSVLAHAFYPKNQYSGQVEIHIDSDEEWFTGLMPPPSNMTSLLAIMIHEIGHALGIHHSEVEDSAMFAWYRVSKENFGDLHVSDVLSVQNLYGKPEGKKSLPVYSPHVHTSTFTPPMVAHDKSADDKQNISICGHVRGKYHFLVVEKRMLIFYKKWVWAMNLMRRQLTPAMLITNWLSFLDKKNEEIAIDAIYQRPNGEVVLFMNNVAYFINIPSLSLSKMMYYTELVSSSNNIQIHGAVNTYRGKTYIFYDNLYFMEIDECNFTPIRYGRIEEEFPGIPNKGISAFRYIDGNLYFIQKKNKLAYIFNEFTGKLMRTQALNNELFDINCSAESIFEQIKNLLGKLVKINYMFSNDVDDDDYEDDVVKEKM